MLKFSILFIILCSLIQHDKTPMKYIAFGDSYTICTGTNNEQERWPNLLAKHLTESGIKTELIANPSRNGFSTQNVIDIELPLLKNQNIDFATLLIGVNDWVRSVDAKEYTKNLKYIINQIQKKLSNPKHLILITIPNFGITPQGSLYSSGRDIGKGIKEFNTIIQSEAKTRGLVCVDIFAISEQMKNTSELVALDGLHPSAKEYAIWESLILKASKEVLK